jgi:hypothetical protein
MAGGGNGTGDNWAMSEGRQDRRPVVIASRRVFISIGASVGRAGRSWKTGENPRTYCADYAEAAGNNENSQATYVI